jgi:hypothetical protein
MRIYKRVIDFDTSVETIRTLVRVFLAITTLRNRLSLVSCIFFMRNRFVCHFIPLLVAHRHCCRPRAWPLTRLFKLR